MIIACEQCLKKFEIESSLIPKKGRLLQCSSCDHKWFYKKNILEETEVVIKKQDIKSKKNEPPVEEINNIKVFEDLAPAKEKKRKHSYKSIQTENKKLSFLNVILVFIISIIALIVLLDTFKSPINLMIPNIEFFLGSLYETLKDILLFIQDLL
jgi:predicted Zn finger-like uncharacterized protein